MLMLYSRANPSPLIFGELDYTMSGHFGIGKKGLKVRQALYWELVKFHVCQLCQPCQECQVFQMLMLILRT